MDEITKLKNEIETLKQNYSNLETLLREHFHDGVTGRNIYIKHLWGFFETVSTAPTTVPRTFWDQIKIYVNGGTLRLYWWDSVANVWHYVTATA